MHSTPDNTNGGLYRDASRERVGLSQGLSLLLAASSGCGLKPWPAYTLPRCESRSIRKRALLFCTRHHDLTAEKDHWPALSPRQPPQGALPTVSCVLVLRRDRHHDVQDYRAEQRGLRRGSPTAQPIAWDSGEP